MSFFAPAIGNNEAFSPNALERPIPPDPYRGRFSLLRSSDNEPSLFSL
jgi:hypothetical protein